MAGHQTSGGYDQQLITQEEHRHLGTDGYKAVIGYTFDGTNAIPVPTGLIPSSYNYIEATPNLTTPTTITFKTGGSGGAIVATLTFAYSGSDITSITKA